jgi:hypothetical protein
MECLSRGFRFVDVPERVAKGKRTYRENWRSNEDPRHCDISQCANSLLANIFPEMSKVGNTPLALFILGTTPYGRLREKWEQMAMEGI